MKFEFSKHAREEMDRREIPESLVENILRNPEEIVDVVGNKKAYQSIAASEAGKKYLVRVIVNDAVSPIKVITVYKTSKIGKYRRKP